jgi:hypothetical protein
LRVTRASDRFARQLAQNGYAVVRGFIGGRLLADLYEHALVVGEVLTEVAISREDTVGDHHVPGSPAYYAEPCMELLLDKLRPRVERFTGKRLSPTYSYMRVYQRGAELLPHTDLPACEISVSLALGHRAPKPWPLWIQSNDRAHPISLEPGDALLYHGIARRHWRRRFRGSHAAQVFLHYVDREGPYRTERFDHRKRLGIVRNAPVPASLVRAKLT